MSCKQLHRRLMVHRVDKHGLFFGGNHESTKVLTVEFILDYPKASNASFGLERPTESTVNSPFPMKESRWGPRNRTPSTRALEPSNHEL